MCFQPLVSHCCNSIAHFLLLRPGRIAQVVGVEKLFFVRCCCIALRWLVSDERRVANFSSCSPGHKRSDQTTTVTEPKRTTFWSLLNSWQFQSQQPITPRGCAREYNCPLVGGPPPPPRGGGGRPHWSCNPSWFGASPWKGAICICDIVNSVKYFDL
jgi:hypothetical protein